MEYADGFPLGRDRRRRSPSASARGSWPTSRAPSTAPTRLGLQHRDLKPGHILVDARLQPKILDFGLSRGEPGPRATASARPRTWRPSRGTRGEPIDARSDVYALGVILYELLCGRPPEARPRAAVRGRPRGAGAAAGGRARGHERRAGRSATPRRWRWRSTSSAGSRAVRCWPGRSPTAGPSSSTSSRTWRRSPSGSACASSTRTRPSACARPTARCSGARTTGSSPAACCPWPQIALYVGAFLLASASVLYLSAYLEDAVHGLLQPALVLLLPFAAISVAAHLLYRRGQRAVAVAFALGAAALLPLAVAIGLRELGWLAAAPGAANELFAKIGNRQLQVALGAGCLWLAVARRADPHGRALERRRGPAARLPPRPPRRLRPAPLARRRALRPPRLRPRTAGGARAGPGLGRGEARPRVVRRAARLRRPRSRRRRARARGPRRARAAAPRPHARPRPRAARSATRTSSTRSS